VRAARTILAIALGVVASAQAMHGQSAERYRDYALGSSVGAVSALSGVPATEVKIIHQRPAALEAMQWRRPYAPTAANTPLDPVQQITFSFYNDQLYRLAIDYDRDRTEGMTDADMVEAISVMYGPASKAPKGSRAGAETDESGMRLARWGDASYSAVLYRSSYASGFRLLVSSPRLDALARTAASQALRLDEREAPQRELARAKKEADDTRTTQEKARLANKAAFRP